MFEPCVLGVDPGVAATGIAAVGHRGRRIELLWADTIRTPADLPEASRLRSIHDHVRQAIAAHRPSSVAIERVAWNKNHASALRVARATGVIMLAAAEAGLAVEEYGPLEVKMAVTGSGVAEKSQVRDALARLHGLADVPSSPDAADAVAIALCHLTQTPLRRAARAVALR
jgi:crossover junction endodeoxyribonuclease RuvC